MSWRNTLPVLDKLANLRLRDEVQQREDFLRRQREGVLFFVNSYNINLDLIRSGGKNATNGLSLGSVCTAVKGLYLRE